MEIEEYHMHSQQCFSGLDKQSPQPRPFVGNPGNPHHAADASIVTVSKSIYVYSRDLTLVLKIFSQRHGEDFHVLRGIDL